MTRLAWRLLRAGGRTGMLGAGMVAAAAAVVTGLLLFAVSANHAFAERADRTAWRVADEADSGATAVQASRLDHVSGQRMTIVDLAELGTGTPPTPPGMDRFPRPGEVWVSPALSELFAELPAEQLADRFPGEVTGELGDSALVHDGELVAVVGYAPDDPVFAAERPGYDAFSPTEIASFDAGRQSDLYVAYRILALLASVLMVVPILVFGGAAARLTVARRDQRLSTLRLVGATPGQVVRLTVVEAVITAAIGALIGTALFLLAQPMLAGIEIDGGTWRPAELWPGVGWLAAVGAAVPILVGLSAVSGLRRVVVGPLGVARRQTPPRLRAARLAVLVVLVVTFVVMTRVAGYLGATGVIILLVLLAGAFASLNLVGAWAVGVVGRITASVARRPSTLLAGRRMIDDPRSAWRTVAGVAMVGFIAGFVALVPTDITEPDGDGQQRLEVTVPTGQADQVAERISDGMAAYDGTATVSVDDDTDEVANLAAVYIAFTGDMVTVDEIRTLLAGLAPGHTSVRMVDFDADGQRMLDDIRTGVFIVMVVVFLVAIVSAGITGASSVLDRRRTYALLGLAGTPLRVLDGARLKETLIPLAVMGGGSVLVGLAMAAPVVGALGLHRGGLILLAVTVSLGVAGVLSASALSRPLLRSVVLHPAPRPD